MTHNSEPMGHIATDAKEPPLPPRPLAPDVPDTAVHETRVTRVELGSFLRTVAPIAMALAILWLGARRVLDLVMGQSGRPPGGVDPGPMREVIGVPIGAFLAALGVGLLLNGVLRLTGGMRLQLKSRRAWRAGWHELVGIDLASALKVAAGCAVIFLVVAVLRPPFFGGVTGLSMAGWYLELKRPACYATLVGLSMLVAAVMYGWLARSWGGLSVECRDGVNGHGPGAVAGRVEVWRVGFLQVALTSAVVPLLFLLAQFLWFSSVPVTSGEPRMIPVALVLTVVLGFGVGACAVGAYNLVALAIGGLVVDTKYSGPAEPDETEDV